MAIFNMISGGYYKKLGNTVGQRFRNKRVAHAYVVPTNPRTNVQQENRTNFADCTGATQLAMQLNGDSLLWKVPNNTVFNARMSLSRQLAESGGALYSYVPVIPYGTEPAYSFELSPTFANHTLTWQCLSTDDLGGRRMAVAIRAHNDNTGKFINYIEQPVITGSAGNWEISITLLPQLSLRSGSWQIGVSCDDGNEARPVIYLPPMDISTLKEKIAVTLSNPVVTWDSANGVYTATVKTTPALASDAAVLATASLTGVLQAEQSVQNTTIQSVTSAGSLAFSFTPNKDALGQRILFPSGSSLEIPAFTAQNGTYIYNVAAASLSFTSQLEKQNYIPSATCKATYSRYELTIQIPSGYTLTQQPQALLYGLTSNDNDMGTRIAAAETRISQSAQSLTLRFSFDSLTAIPTSASGIPLYFTQKAEISDGNITYSLYDAQKIQAPQPANLNRQVELNFTITDETPKVLSGIINQPALEQLQWTLSVLDMAGTERTYIEIESGTETLYPTYEEFSLTGDKTSTTESPTLELEFSGVTAIEQYLQNATSLTIYDTNGIIRFQGSIFGFSCTMNATFVDVYARAQS